MGVRRPEWFLDVRPLNDEHTVQIFNGLAGECDYVLDRNFVVLRRPVESAQYFSIRYSERLADNDIVASVGSKGDSYDNAMAESFNGLYKWELIYPQGPWRGLDDIEFATMTYVDWFNQRRLHGEITSDATYTIPAEAETDYYRQKQPAEEAATQ
jgi:putative transposase